MKIKLGIRAYIYPVIAILISIFMYMHTKKLAQPSKMRPAMPADAEMSVSIQNDEPSLYLFGDEKIKSAVDELRSSLKGKCSVLHIASPEKDVQEYFGISKLPSAILFDKEHNVLQRFDYIPAFEEIQKTLPDSTP